ncbi:MAG: sulfotransferase family protein [Rhizobiaceae bacterium]
MSYKPVIIIGAARSGTNILRDTLSVLPGWDTWDCDEINLIWRHGNLELAHDKMDESHARPEVAKFIRRQFEDLHKKTGCQVILEKTCANSLRIPFIESVFPDARYIYIVRDGRDVVLSAMKRWTASVELAYLFKKLRYVPMSDVPRHGISFIRNRLSQAVSSEKRQSCWGPVFPGMRELASHAPLVEVCANQWASCVEESDRAIAKLPGEKWIKVTYEELVSNSDTVLSEILKWYYKFDTPPSLPQDALMAIHAGSLNSWKRKREMFTTPSLENMKEILDRHGYEPSI